MLMHHLRVDPPKVMNLGHLLHLFQGTEIIQMNIFCLIFLHTNLTHSETKITLQHI